METPTPSMVCSLEGLRLVGRSHAWRQVASRATDRRIEGDRVIGTYPKDEQLLRQIRGLIDAEAACCSFLKFTVDEGPDLTRIELRLPEEMPASLRTLILELDHEDRPGGSDVGLGPDDLALALAEAPAPRSDDSDGRRIGPVGTWSRVAVGTALLAGGLLTTATGSSALAWYDVAARSLYRQGAPGPPRPLSQGACLKHPDSPRTQ